MPTHPAPPVTSTAPPSAAAVGEFNAPATTHARPSSCTPAYRRLAPPDGLAAHPPPALAPAHVPPPPAVSAAWLACWAPAPDAGVSGVRECSAWPAWPAAPARVPGLPARCPPPAVSAGGDPAPCMRVPAHAPAPRRGARRRDTAASRPSVTPSSSAAPALLAAASSSDARSMSGPGAAGAAHAQTRARPPLRPPRATTSAASRARGLSRPRAAARLAGGTSRRAPVLRQNAHNHEHACTRHNTHTHARTHTHTHTHTNAHTRRGVLQVRVARDAPAAVTTSSLAHPTMQCDVRRRTDTSMSSGCALRALNSNRCSSISSVARRQRPAMLAVDMFPVLDLVVALDYRAVIPKVCNMK